VARYSFQYGVKWSTRQRPREMVGVVPVITVYDKNYRNAGQAATTIAWLIVNNVASRFTDRRAITQDKIDALYAKARRRVLPICKKILKT
jgi:hypothetical protein